MDSDARLHGARVPKEGIEAKGELLEVFSLDVTEAKLEIKAGLFSPFQQQEARKIKTKMESKAFPPQLRTSNPRHFSQRCAIHPAS